MQALVCRAVILGQFLALLIAATASASVVLARQVGVSFPTLQSALNYLLLAIVYGPIHFWHSGARSVSRPLWHYALLTLIDVEANFLVVMAFRYTSLTSVTLLDCWSIPVALSLTRLMGLAVYRRGHYAGATLCVAGLAVLVITDKMTGGDESDPRNSSSSRPLIGDILVLLGATLYAACNVLQEHILGDVAVSELLCMLGIFGVIWSLLQGLPLELPALLAAPWTASAALPWIGYGIALFSFYSLVPFQLSWGGAAWLNLSLLSSDLWTGLARFIFFGGFTAWSGGSFAVSFVLLAVGIAIFSFAGDAKHGDEPIPGGKRLGPSYQVLPIDGDGNPASGESIHHSLGEGSGCSGGRNLHSMGKKSCQPGRAHEMELGVSPPA